MNGKSAQETFAPTHIKSCLSHNTHVTMFNVLLTVTQLSRLCKSNCGSHWTTPEAISEIVFEELVLYSLALNNSISLEPHVRFHQEAKSEIRSHGEAPVPGKNSVDIDERYGCITMVVHYAQNGDGRNHTNEPKKHDQRKGLR